MEVAGINSIVRLDSVDEIEAGLIMDQIRSGKAAVPTLGTIAKYSRKQGAKD